MFIRFLRFLLGYVNFSIKGEFPERLLNQLSFRGVSVWNMRREDGLITACIKTSDYLKIFKYRGKNRVFTHVLSRHGLPFFITKYRLRLGFVIGVFLYFFMLVFFSNFVWNVEVVGNESIETAKILSALRELGLSEGVKISSVDQHTLPSRLALKIDGIAWASVNIEGVKVTVNISESIKTEKYDNEPCNLIAKCDGIITKTEVKNGTLTVDVGQTVKKGDLLVSGFTEYKDGSASLGVSKGEIIAKTERELSVFIPFSKTETIAVGQSKTKRVLNFFGLKIPLYLGSIKQDCFVEQNIITFNKNGMYLPIFLWEAKFTPKEEITIEMSETKTLEEAHRQLTDLEQTDLKNAEIISKETVAEFCPDGIKLKGIYVCRENIAETQFLLIYADN